MKVENNIVATRFEELKEGTAFFFSLSEKIHICMKIIEQRPNGDEICCLSLSQGYSNSHSPGVFTENVVDRSEEFLGYFL